jgi:hypothetical protein
MKKITELTEQEILKLTDDQVKTMIKLKKAEEGIKFLAYPKAPELFNVKLPDTDIFTCVLFGDSLAFTDFDELKGLIGYLENCKSKHSIDHNYNLSNSGNKKYICRKLKTSGYSNDPWMKIESQKVYSHKDYEDVKDQLAQNKKLTENYEKELKAWAAANDESKWISTEIWDKVNEVRTKYYELQQHCYRFANDYIPLADNKESVAMKFMDKAYSLSDEQKEYILANYKV